MEREDEYDVELKQPTIKSVSEAANMAEQLRDFAQFNKHQEISLSGVEVPITPKSFFRLNKSLHLFETHCAILPLFNPNIDLLQTVKVTKSGHHRRSTEQVRDMGLFLV